MLRVLSYGSIVVFMTLASSWQVASASQSVQEIIAQANAVNVDTSAVYEVRNLLIEDGPITLSLDSGTVFFLTAVAGHQVAAVFLGTGTAKFHPTSRVERQNLTRFYTSDSYMEEITQAYMLFGDTMTADMFHGPRAQLPKRGVGDHVRMVKSMLVGQSGMIDEDILRCLANRWNEPVFQVQALGPSNWECYMSVSPFRDERYRLSVTKVSGNIRSWVMAVMCNAAGVPIEARDDGSKPGDVVFMEAHTLDVRFDRSLDLVATDRIRLRAVRNSTRLLDLNIDPNLSIDSVSLDDGTLLSITYNASAGQCWVELPSELQRDSVITFRVHYHGDIIQREKDYTILLSSIQWYPAHSAWQKSVFDVTYTYPDHMKLVSVGELQHTSNSGDQTIANWLTSTPIRNASFHIGLFRERKVDTEQDAPACTMLYQTINQADAVAIDLSQALTFFSRLFGPLPIKHLYATELPGTHGEAFVGLLHLSSYAFSSTDGFFTEQFLAHEVAHQWWGIDVEFATYRDQWLSEAFAEYSALMYSQSASKDREKFFDLLKNYQSFIVERGRKLVGSNDKPPSIALGYRVQNGGSRRDYSIYVYYKGAWVLHMLRNMLLDLETMKEDQFLGTLTEFYKSYRSHRPATSDFIRIAEKHAGVDLKWFFDQWVNGTSIPTYTVAWKKEQQANGTWKVKLRVRQSNVDENFRMYIPVKVTFDNGTLYRIRMHMTGSVAEVDLPLFSDEPNDLAFNDLSSVLCEVNEESFD